MRNYTLDLNIEEQNTQDVFAEKRYYGKNNRSAL
jgi:hypothetical protein